MKRKILIFNVNWLGDVLFSTAAIRNIRYAYPDAFIGCVIPPRCLAVLENNGYLDEVIVFDEAGRHKGLIGLVRFTAYLRGFGFDTVFLLHRSATRALICLLAGIRQRIGYATAKRGWLLTRKIAPPSMDDMHRIDYYLTVIKQAGLPVVDRHTDFFVTDADMQAADRFLGEQSAVDEGYIVGIHPAGNWGPKRWPKENIARLADRLISECRAAVIFTGSKDEQPLIDEIAALMKEKPLSACGKLTLKQFACLCKAFDVFISADSGPLHIANAVGTRRIIALFGPTDPEVTGPYPDENVTILRKDTGCRIPCYRVDCADNRCMKAIKVEDVVPAVKESLRR